MPRPKSSPGPGGGIYAGVVVSGTQRQYIRAGVERGLSGNEIYAAMLEAGIAPRRQALFDVRREVLGTQRAGRVLGNTPKKFRPSSAGYEPVAAHGKARYRTSAAITISNPVTGEPVKLHGVYVHNDLEPMKSIDDHILTNLRNALSAYDINAADLRLGDYRGEAFSSYPEF